MGVFDILPGLGGDGEAAEAEPSTDSGDTGGEAVDSARPADLSPADFRERAEALTGRSDVPTLDFTVDALEALDGLAAGPPSAVDDQVAYGSYLGETIVREYGGEWTDEDGWQVAVELPDDRTTVAIFDAAEMSIAKEPVFAKVAARLEAEGAERTPDAPDDPASDEGVDGESAVPDSSTALGEDDPAAAESGDETPDVDAGGDERTDDHATAESVAPDPTEDAESGVEETGDASDDADVTVEPEPVQDRDQSDDAGAVADVDAAEATDGASDDADGELSGTDDAPPTAVGDDSSETDSTEPTADHVRTGVDAADEDSSVLPFADEPDDADAEAEPVDEDSDDAPTEDSGDVVPIYEEADDSADGDTADDADEADDAAIADDAVETDDADTDDAMDAGDSTVDTPTTAIGDAIDPVDSRLDADDSLIDAAGSAADGDEESGVDDDVDDDPIDETTGDGADPDTDEDPVDGDDATDGDEDDATAGTDPVDEDEVSGGDDAEAEDVDPVAPERYVVRAAAEELADSWPDHDLDFTPESLPRLDAFVDDQWDGRFRASSLADRAVDHEESDDPLTQLGAYYAEVLIRWLDGEWVATDDGEGAVAVPDVGEKVERVDVFALARDCLVAPSTFAYRYDALVNRLYVDEPAISDGRTDVFDDDRDSLTSGDVITQFAVTADEFVDEWDDYLFDYSPPSLRDLDEIANGLARDADLSDVPLSDETDPESLWLTARATAAGAYFAAILLRHRDAQWRIGDDVELVIDRPAGEHTVDPVAAAADCLRGEGNFVETYTSLSE